MFNWNMGGLEGICFVEKIQGWNSQEMQKITVLYKSIQFLLNI